MFKREKEGLFLYDAQIKLKKKFNILEFKIGRGNYCYLSADVQPIIRACMNVQKGYLN